MFSPHLSKNRYYCRFFFTTYLSKLRTVALTCVARTHTHTDARAHTCSTYIHAHARRRVRALARAHAHSHARTRAPAPTHAHTHIHTHTHTQKHRPTDTHTHSHASLERMAVLEKIFRVHTSNTRRDWRAHPKCGVQIRLRVHTWRATIHISVLGVHCSIFSVVHFMVCIKNDTQLDQFMAEDFFGANSPSFIFLIFLPLTSCQK